MAENVSLTPGTGDIVAADEILSVKYQRVKLIHGINGVNSGDVATTNPLPIIGINKYANGTAHSSSEIIVSTNSSKITTTGYSQITIYWDITAITGLWLLVLRGYNNNNEYGIDTIGPQSKVDNYRRTVLLCDSQIDVRLEGTGALTSSVRYYMMRK